VTAPLRAAANWYPDPLARGEYRYWDGERWTQWIATHGTTRPDTFDLPAEMPAPVVLAPSIAPPPPQWTQPIAAQPTSMPMPMPMDTLRYRSISGLSVALTWLLGAVLIVALGFAGACVNRLSKLDAFEEFATFARLDALNDADELADGMSNILSLLMLAVFVVLIVHLYRASKNTDLWDRTSRTWGPGWAIGGWFIPLANFVIPFLVVRDIWRRTPEPRDGSEPGGGILVFWWVCFAVGVVAAQIDVSPDTIEEFRAQDWAHIVGAVLLAVSALPLVRIVRTLDRRQRETAFPTAPTLPTTS
jgi:hypothetical protein